MELVLKLYDRLSGGNVILPPVLGFILDREGLTDEQMKDLERHASTLQKRARQDSELLLFLDKVMYENYLLHPQAIACFLQTLEDEAAEDEEQRGTHCTPEQIHEWMNSHKGDPKYYKHYKRKTKEEKEILSKREDWHTHVHAATMLNDLFHAMTGGRFAYDKVRHSKPITKWLLNHDPRQLEGIAVQIRKLQPG